ncbi:MAG: CaiB/BaiF CoA-transferase family protein [Alphaproteobacteria bacterium]|jgi:crotonobetainyl-CoA:carnitine CoA-transferase CaiB-like acyl-CoA transferase|nr:CaiB/BaiF CoA-transferase family protein [Alphaproteobacteria bacterium]
MTGKTLPLDGLLVLDFAQFLSGPLCGLRLADLGARVIKIERPSTGDLGRHLYLSDKAAGAHNSLFQAIDRNKESFAVDLKNEHDREQVFGLIAEADVLIQNFRPGVFDRLGFSYDVVSKINPRLIYASVTGYGSDGPWVDLPGQDLLAQARSGVMWLNGNRSDVPQAVGLSVGDMLAGHGLIEGILAKLVQRGVTGKGGQVETSLLECLVDFQFEVLTSHLNNGGQGPVREPEYGAHAYLPAPYGVFATADGFIAIAMAPVDKLMALLTMEDAAIFADPSLAFSERGRILNCLGARISEATTQHWLSVLQPHDIWCAEVLGWNELLDSDGFRNLDFIQEIDADGAAPIKTTRMPVRIDRQILTSRRPAPCIGEHTDSIRHEFGI